MLRVDEYTSRTWNPRSWMHGYQHLELLSPLMLTITTCSVLCIVRREGVQYITTHALRSSAPRIRRMHPGCAHGVSGTSLSIHILDVEHTTCKDNMEHLNGSSVYMSTSVPTVGITVIRLVITVSAQKDISPHGNT